MAYDNGRKVNRYAAQKHHRDELKRRHTPEQYASYEDYCEAQRRKDEEIEMWLYGNWPEDAYEKRMNRIQKRREDGILDYYEKWWKAYSYFCGPGWKKNLKNFANRKRRRYYKQFCDDASEIEDLDDFDSPMIERFDDPWNWD